MAKKSVYEMTDEEIMSLEAPPEPEEDEGEGEEVKEDKSPEEPEVNNPEPEPENKEEEESSNNSSEEEKVDTSSGSEDKGTKEEDKSEEQVEDVTKQVNTSTQTKKSDILATNNEQDSDINYQEFYSKVMAPFKANGKTITLKSADEAIQLMQQGANYTRKMQAIAPYRKTLMMLEKANLLDENKLSYLIDVNNGNQEAIKKLLQDHKIDPLGFDAEQPSNYQPGQHRVSDAEVLFRSTLDDLASTQEGQATVREISTNWDDASKVELYKNPNLMRIINQQYHSGIYNQVADEVYKRRLLGQIPANTPFIIAYDQVGREMAMQHQQAQISKNTQPLAVKPAIPKVNVTNAARAKAASPTRSNPKPAKPIINPLAMSDEEFMKQFGDKY